MKLLIELEKLFLNKMSWKLNLNSVYDYLIEIFHILFYEQNSNYKKLEIIEGTLDLINFCFTDFNVYYKFSEFHILISCILFSLQNFEEVTKFEIIEEFFIEDSDKIKSCMCLILNELDKKDEVDGNEEISFDKNIIFCFEKTYKEENLEIYAKEKISIINKIEKEQKILTNKNEKELKSDNLLIFETPVKNNKEISAFNDFNSTELKEKKYYDSNFKNKSDCISTNFEDNSSLKNKRSQNNLSSTLPSRVLFKNSFDSTFFENKREDKGSKIEAPQQEENLFKRFKLLNRKKKKVKKSKEIFSKPICQKENKSKKKSLKIISMKNSLKIPGFIKNDNNIRERNLENDII